MKQFVLITGCSGGGKSTLLQELKRRGHSVIEEPGRRIVAEERAGAGTALPWVDLAAFARRAVEMARSDLASAVKTPGTIFFDRGLVDAAVALQFAAGVPCAETMGTVRPYDDTVFLAPPWPELFETDGDRRHDMSAAVDEFERLQAALEDMGYDIQLLPKLSVEARADFVLETINSTQ